MTSTLPLHTMTLTEKLQLMEALWDDLTRDEETLESPAWHEEELLERDRRLATGEAQMVNWEEAKRTLRQKTGL